MLKMPESNKSRIKGQIIRPFDPWGSAECTCPPKLTFNPYTGCAHGCLYCYITWYIPRAFEVRTKEGLLRKVERDLENLEIDRSISLSNSSDPYPPMEKELRITRRILEMFAERQVSVQIVTKSDLVARDADLLANCPSVVSFSSTTMDEELTKELEPGAPLPERRIEAMGRLKDRGIPVVARIDPVVPGLNDSQESLEALFSRLDGIADHVVGSTFKPRPDGFMRMIQRFPRAFHDVDDIYGRKGNVWMPREDVRFGILIRLKELSERGGMTFGTCREGGSALHTATSCDGMHLLLEKEGREPPETRK
jgi:DNA repair photolyase